MDELKLIVASNIIRLRTGANMTQAELGERIKYSDKTISKWERAESMPDVYVLKQMANMFNVSVDFFLCSHDEWQNPEKEKDDNAVYNIITAITLASIFTIAFLVFSIFWILGVVEWKIFAYSLSVALIAWLVLNSVWYKGKKNVLIVFFLVLSVIANVYISLLPYNPWQLFIVAIPAEIIVLLSFAVVRVKNK